MSSPSNRRHRVLVALLCAATIGIVSELQGQLVRAANTTLNLPADLPGGTFSTANAFPGLTFTDPVAIVTPPGETNRLFVLEKPGRIIVIPDLTAPVKQTFLDISSRTNSGGEEGLLGLAFHPNYNNAGQQGHGEFFIFYQTNQPGQRHFRVSRFSVSAGNPNLANSGSEQPLITQRDQAGNHNGGDLHFGDDGYLYISVGDEGGANDTYDNSQHIDKDFFGTILRIDIDRLPANLEPNAHAAVHAGTYKVPADNPFIGATSFNGIAVTPANVRTEIWAIGMRNPWRMSFDRPTGRLFVADVGQGSREEIDILSPAVFATNGGIPNYGWSYREGFADFNNGPGGADPPVGFSHIEPIHDYPRSQGQSVTGGLVYRGANYPELTGDYLFSDYASGRVWAMDDPGGPGQAVTQIATEHNVAGFGIHPLTGDVLLADLGNDQIKRLVRTPGGSGQPPALLSQTGAFSDLATLAPNAGIVPYDINVSFWSDNAVKTRWFSIPDVNDDMTWTGEGNWSFPEGQVWIKHFELDLDRDNPGTNLRRLETRFLVKTADDVYGITYRWDDQQTDAELVAESGLAEDFTITEDGGQRVQTWKYPSRNDCRTCHTEVGGFPLGFNTRQLNADFDHGAGPANQIDELESAGYFTNNPPDPATLAKFFAADDESASLEDRARSYLAANCVQCHQPGGLALGNFDARPEIPLANAGMIDGALVNNDGDPFNRVVVEGSPAHSMILQRLEAVEGPSTLAPMPPLGSCVTNQGAIDLLTDWINSTKKILFVRGADRSGGFFEAGNDASRTEHLASIFNDATNGGNHGWGELATALEAEGYLLEEVAEPLEAGAPSTGQTTGEHLPLETINLDQYCAIVFGSNNAVYDGAAIDAVDAYVRGGGSALFISDANFGGDWADAPNSDQQFLDRFGLIMNQDQGTYAIRRADGEFNDPTHPIFDSVDEFLGEGVSPISIGTLPPDVTATVLGNAEGQVRRNVPPFGGNNQGPSTAATASDGALVIANAGLGKVAGHFDRNTFFNDGGVGSDITRFDNRQYAINLFNWLCAEAEPLAPVDPPVNVTATDGAHDDRVAIAWTAVTGATSYQVFRNTADNSGTATEIGAPSASNFNDTTAIPGVGYFYWVKSMNAAHESGFSASDAGRRGISAPAQVAASDGTFANRVEITWAAVHPQLSYEVWRNTVDVSGTATLLGAAPGTSFDDTTVTAGQVYYYWVRARNGAETGPLSVASDSGFSQPGPPTGVTATNRVAGVRIDWDDVAFATEFRVYRWTNLNVAQAIEIAGLPAGTTTYLDATAAPGRPFYFFVRYVVNGEFSDYSAGVIGMRIHPPPGNVTATDGNFDDKIRIGWEAIDHALEYIVFRNTSASETGKVEIARVDAGTLTFDDLTADPGMAYFYSVQAAVPAGSESAASDWEAGIRSALPVFRPDELIGRTAASRVGDGIVNESGAGQLVQIRSKRRRTIRFFLEVQNDGVLEDGITVRGTRGNRVFRANYFEKSAGGGRRNVTAGVVTASFEVSLASGAGVEMELDTKRKGRKNRGIKGKTFVITGTSVNAPERKDRVRGKVNSG